MEYNHIKVCTGVFFDSFILWLCWIFTAAHGLSPVAVSGATQHRSAQAFPAAAAPVAARRLQQLQLPGSRAQAQQLGHMGFSCAVACGILAGQGLNPRPLHWQMESHPLYHRGSPVLFCFVYFLQRARPYLFGS